MRFFSVLTLLCSSVALASELQLNSRAPKCPQTNGNKDDEIITKYKATGQCFSYIGNGNRDKSMASCSGPDGYCQKVKGMTKVAGCKSVIPEGVKPDQSTLFKDEDCNQWYPGECLCECELCDEIAKFVIEGLEQLDNVICAVMLSSFKSIADVGLLFVPGGQASSAVKAAVQGAKSFYENGEEAASFFGNWVGPACGIPDFDFDISMVFGSLLRAPDSMSRGAPVGCKKKAGGCRKVDPVPDPTKKPDAPTVKPSDKPAQPTTITKPVETTAQVATTTTSTTTSSETPGAGCAYCGEFGRDKAARDDKYQAMYARAGNANNGPVCVMPPKDEGAAASKRSLSELLRDNLFTRALNLAPRSLTMKMVVTKLGKAETGYECFVGRYAPSSDAEKIPEISKYWAFKDPGTSQQCSVEVVKVAKADIKDYQTDHVFEAQTLTNFITWLASEDGAKVGTTYDKPSAAWVLETLLGNLGNKHFVLKSPGNTNPGDLFTPSDGVAPVVVMAYGFGRSDGVKSISKDKYVERIPAARGNKNLVLLHKHVNGPKGIWFRKFKPDLEWSTFANQEAARVDVRKGVGAFQYLAASVDATETMWKKWGRVSNWIDLVCHEFDKQYKWGSRADEPKNSAGTASLRSLWAFFIDKELGEIEAKAAKWGADAKKNFDKKYTRLTRAEKKWRDDAFEKGGFATGDKMKFPRPAGLPAGASVYGAYGWSDVTRDAADKNPNIGSPIKIT